MRDGTEPSDPKNYFDQADPSIHMLELPKSRARLGGWGVVAILAGAILALAVLMLGGLQF